MGDASVPTLLLTSPAPTIVTICPKKPTVERRWDRARDRYIVALLTNVMTSLLQNLQGSFHILLFDQ